MNRTLRVALWPALFTLRCALFLVFVAGASLAVAEHQLAKVGRG